MFEDRPRVELAVVVGMLAMLMGIALLLRLAIDVDGVLDIDVTNFGLAALRFDVVQHQPQPPGYLGYVMLLKAVHALAPGLGPLDIAKWGCRLTGVATVPAAWWACRAVSGSGVRPLLAAAVAVVHPVLWYYGGDGQSHGADALFTLLLVAGAAHARRSSWVAVVVLAFAFGLAGGIRPTTPALIAPFLVWALWGRPSLVWVMAVVGGVAGVAAWLVPTLVLTGGWGLFARAQHALFTELFFTNYSVFAAGRHPRWFLLNVTIALWSTAFAALPFVMWSTGTAAWRRALWASVALAVAFYVLIYTAEIGYLAGVAGLACLAPAAWPAAAPRLRVLLFFVAAPALMLFGPAGLPTFTPGVTVDATTLARVVETEHNQLVFEKLVCDVAQGAPALVIDDDPITTHTRLLPLRCPHVVLGLFLRNNPLNPRLDNWELFYAEGMDSLPTPVPLEVGPPARGRLRFPVARVILAPDASDALLAELRAAATCAPEPSEMPWPDAPVSWPARCLPELRVGRNVVEVPGL